MLPVTLGTIALFTLSAFVRFYAQGMVELPLKVLEGVIYRLRFVEVLSNCSIRHRAQLCGSQGQVFHTLAFSRYSNLGTRLKLAHFARVTRSCEARGILAKRGAPSI